MISTFNIEARYIKTMLPTAGVADVRAYLNTIHFDVSPKRIIMVSTDGQVLAALYLPKTARMFDTGSAPQSAKLTIPTSAFTSLGRRGTSIRVSYGAAAKGFEPGDPVSIVCDGITRTIDSVDGSYPSWRAVIPLEASRCSSTCDTFNPELLMRVVKAAKAMGRAASQVYLTYGRQEGHTAVARIDREPGYVAVLAPIKPAESPAAYGVPDWLREA